MFKISVIITATILETRCWRLSTRHAFIVCFNLWEWNLHSLHLTNSEAGLSRFSDLPKFIWVSTWKVKVKSLSRVQLFATPWTVAHQAPLSMGFSRQEYWSGLPFPSPGGLPDPGIEPRSPALEADALTSETPGNQDLNPGVLWL